MFLKGKSLDAQTTLFVFLCLSLMVTLDSRVVVLVILFCLFHLLIKQHLSSLVLTISFFVTLTPLIIGGFLTSNSWFIPWSIYLLIGIVLFRLSRECHRRIDSESLTNINLILVVLFALGVSSKFVSNVDFWAWQLRGDSMNYIVSIRSLSEGTSLFSSTILKGDDYGLPLGSSFSIQWLTQQILNMTGGSSRDLSDLATSFLGINIFAWVVILLGSLEASRGKALYKKLLIVLLISILLLSWINAGLTMSNGFVTVPLTVSLLYLLLLNSINQNPDSPLKLYLFAQSFLLTILLSTWSFIAVVPLAITAFSIIENLLPGKQNTKTFGLRHTQDIPYRIKWLFRFSSLVLLHVGFLKLLSFPDFSNVLLRTGGFPNLSYTVLAVAPFCVISLLFLVSRSTSRNLFYLVNVSGVFIITLGVFFERASQGSLLRGLRSLWVSETYYFQKATWLILSAVFFVSLTLLVNHRKFWVILLALTLLTVQQKSSPSGLWKRSERSLVSYEAIIEIDQMPSNSRVMYFNFDNWLGDAYLISLSGLQFESYNGNLNGPREYDTTTFMPSNSFAGRAYYTNEANALCVGQGFIGPLGQIKTRDSELEMKLQKWCGNGPFPEVVVYDNG